MKTKSITAVFTAIAIVSQLAAAAGDGGGGGEPVTPTPFDPNLNPLNIARAFALKTPDYYQGQLYGQMLIGGNYQFTIISFKMEKDFSITSLLVDDTVIPLPNPIYGLPMGDGGVMRNAYLYVNAMTTSGDYAGNGYLQKAIVNKGDSLVVELIPAEIKQEIFVDASHLQGRIQLTIEDFPYGYGWGIQDGRFYVYLPPVGGKYHYIIRDNGGVVIASGWLEPFKAPTTTNDTYVGVKYLGGVIGAEFPQPDDGTDAWVTVGSVSFDCNVPLSNGTTGSGKVIFADCGAGGLEVQMFTGQCHVFVQSVTASGDMPFLVLNDNSTPSTTRVSTADMNVGKVVITLVSDNPSDNTWLLLHRNYGDGGGGLGVQSP